jgi:small multidrug resistance family-3 protein
MSGPVSAALPTTLLLYALAALAEIAGCFSAWAALRLGRSPLWLLPGLLALALFAYLLTLAPADAAGRAYAAYGGVYIAASVLWLQVAESVRPDRYDLLGAAVCLLGAGIVLFAPRAGA